MCLGRVQAGERLLSQLLLRPAPDDWADGFQSLTRPPDVRVKTESPLGLGGGLLMVAGVGLGLVALLQTAGHTTMSSRSPVARALSGIARGVGDALGQRGRQVDQSQQDEQTSSEWDVLGHAVSGPQEGRQLTPIVAINYFWFSWVAFKPETRIYQP